MHYPEWTEASVSPATQDAVTQVFRALYKHERTGTSVELSPDARQLWKDWNATNTKRLRGSNGIASAMYSKMQVQLARLALVLHCLTYPDAPSEVQVSAEVMNDAIELSEYFVRHNLLVFSEIERAVKQQTITLADRVLRVLQDSGCQPVSRTQLNSAFSGNRSSEEITTACQELLNRGLVTVEKVATGGRPAEWLRCTEELKNGETGKAERAA